MSDVEARRKLFQEIHELLFVPFQEGTVEYKNDSERSAHIPVQAYNHRINTVAGNHAQWRLTSERPIIYDDQMVSEMRGVLQIVDQSYEGQGFVTFERANGRIKHFGE